VITKIEERLGRLEPLLFKGDVETFNSQKEHVLERVVKGKHLEESPDFDFSTVGDPFEQYLFRIKPEDLEGNEGEGQRENTGVATSEMSQEAVSYGARKHGKVQDMGEEEQKSYMQRELER